MPTTKSDASTVERPVTAVAVKKAGVYDIPMEQYVADPAPEPSLNSGVAFLLDTRSPAHARLAHPRLNPDRQSDDSTASDVGSAAHMTLLDGNLDRVTFVDARDWRTKIAREQRDEARESGRIPLLESRRAELAAMATAAAEALDNSEFSDALAGHLERTLIWQDTGAWCRCRPDMAREDWSVVIDYKTTTCALPEAFRRVIEGNGYDIQGALVRRGIRALGLHGDPKIAWLVQETKPPYACSVVGMSPVMETDADVRVGRAMEAWAEALATKDWPPYPLRTVWVDPSPWRMAQWENVE